LAQSPLIPNSEIRIPHSILVCVFVYNEGAKLSETLGRFPADRNYDVLVVDDGSSDGAGEIVKTFPFAYLRHETNRGIGAAFRTAFEFAFEKGYGIFVPMAGNGKMHPSDIPALVNPILDGKFDYVQGSRYLSGGRHENLPLFRRIAIPMVSWMIGILSGFPSSDVTCGFRAYRLEIVRRKELDITQQWLDKYEMEYYIHYYAIQLGYRVTEAPVAMTYPASKKNYSKIPAFSGWWSMLRPWVFLYLGLKR
jgi:dolichol-phosphate mannosyltransferase